MTTSKMHSRRGSTAAPLVKVRLVNDEREAAAGLPSFKTIEMQLEYTVLETLKSIRDSEQFPHMTLDERAKIEMSIARLQASVPEKLI